MNVFNDHRKLFPIAGLLFLILTFLTAIMPAIQNQKNNAPLPDSEPLTGDALAGKLIYIREGCVACHTQQVRNVDMDRVFGARPGIAADYANMTRTSFWQNTATLMGTERTGPDLTDVGNRQPIFDWHLMHLYNPRIVVEQSIMPGFEWLFEIKKNPLKSDVIVSVPKSFMHGKEGEVVAKKEVLQLIAYLQSLKQLPLPEAVEPMTFLYEAKKKKADGGDASVIDGHELYVANCQSCHQENGEGLKGAFPPLKGSPIVTGENLELYVDIIMNGYDARPEYSVMAGIGTNMEWTEHEVTAIINYERHAWGNTGDTLSVEAVKKILDFIKIKTAASE
ncbi:MAG: cytochrome c [Bacteroidota bacterium]|nr:cytochrome c [Bacteroidota bacterium]